MAQRQTATARKMGVIPHLGGELYPLHAGVVEGEVAALRLGERPDLHRGDVGELRLQVAAHGVPYLRQRQTVGLTEEAATPAAPAWMGGV